ncbi:glycine zipper 2TM domain-containing protein [Sphingomonas baiyangensis]|uniref:17 kDa surface antigen n=1 Tax=Sphingomonas baiyangensis TaxID=2572576 RepID=A0A4U1L9E1_9SPHN|nr:glycine zipper 2TM domain-containing protein [Sphingomonas baiyangensis]TKD52936.1 glycine zipper 2TM domain-containing protein [Sphingomonas baiyangensis]
MFKKLTLAGAAILMGTTAAHAAPTAVAPTGIGTASTFAVPGIASADASADFQRRWRGDDRRYYGNNRRRTPRRCSSTEGTVIGAVAGGLLGNQVAGRGDRLLGTVLGGGVGALAGREIDRAGQPRGCRRFR